MELQSIRKKIWKMNKYYPNFDHWIFIISFKVWKNPEITIWTESNSQLAYIFQGHNYWKREWERVSGKYKLHTIYQCMYTILAGRGFIKVGFFQFGKTLFWIIYLCDMANNLVFNLVCPIWASSSLLGEESSLFALLLKWWLWVRVCS